MANNKDIPDPPEGFVKISGTVAVKDIPGESIGEPETYMDCGGILYVKSLGRALSMEEIEDMAKDPYKAFGLVEKEKKS